MRSMKNNPEHSMPYHLRGAFRGFETALARYLDGLNVPLSFFYIIRQQWDGDGCSQSLLAANSFMTESVASQVIKKMIADGLLRRERDKTDGRAWIIHLTKKGKSLREEVVSYGMNLSSKHEPDISRDDMLTAIDVLKKVRAAFDDYNEDYFQNHS